mmetsp:Transcript_131782/g.256667  ORF Transcript_131782/g.256667 Transcript_131782/m.256667 type:complete len:93 (-) Transcript_131782:1668-1946(-)
MLHPSSPHAVIGYAISSSLALSAGCSVAATSRTCHGGLEAALWLREVPRRQKRMNEAKAVGTLKTKIAPTMSRQAGSNKIPSALLRRSQRWL